MATLAITSVTMTATTTATIETAGEALSEGDSVYELDNKFYKTDGDAEATAASKGLVVGDASGDGVKFTLARSGDLILGATMVPNTTYGVSPTAGAVEPLTDLTTGNHATQVFVAKTTTTVKLQVAALQYQSA